MSKPNIMDYLDTVEPSQPEPLEKNKYGDRIVENVGISSTGLLHSKYRSGFR